MAVRSLRSMVRLAVCDGTTFSSPPGIYGLRNGLSHLHGTPMLDAALSGFVGSRGIHSRGAAQTTQTVHPRAGIVVQGSLGTAAVKGARRLHVLRDVMTGDADLTFTAMAVTAFSALAGVWYWKKDEFKDTDKSVLVGSDTPSIKTEAYLRAVEASAELHRVMSSYKEEVVEDDMNDDPAIKAKFEDWMKEYGRTYKDDKEKAWRFRIFKANARHVDAKNAYFVESGSSLRLGLTKFADKSIQEFRFRFPHTFGDVAQEAEEKRVAKLCCEGISSENQSE